MIFFKKILLLIVTLLVLSFSGCTSTKKQNNMSVDIPSWYLNAPNNNSVYLYGTGEGSTLNESKNVALNNLASKLSVKVSSVINTYKTSSTNSSGDSFYNKDVSQDLNIEIEKMRFSNINIEKSTQLGNSFFTLVKISRDKLFNETFKEFSLLDSSINENLNVISTKSTLEQIKDLENLYPKLNDAKKDAFLLYTINNEFDYSKYIRNYDKNINKIDILKDGILINVTTNENSKFFYNQLLQLLNENSYKVSTNGNVNIIINNDKRYSVARGWQIVKVSTTIKTMSNNKTLSNITINSVGRSTSSQENALAQASMHFKKQLHEIGLNSILFSK